MLSHSFTKVKAEIEGLREKTTMLSISHFIQVSLAVGILIAGASNASAQDWRSYQQSRPYPYQNQYRNYNNSYDRLEELQEHVAHDRALLDEAIRCGRDDDASRQAADLARDQRLLQDQARAVGGDQAYRYSNNRGYSNRGWGFTSGRH